MSRLLPLLFLFTACAPTDSPRLAEGTWTGGLSAHEGHYLALTYDIRYEDGALALDLLGPEGQRFVAREVVLVDSALHFVWTEPEAGLPLQCVFALQAEGRYAGPCADASGKAADFTMVPPAP